MGEYRLYYTDRRGRIFAAEDIEARSDDDAVAIAREKSAASGSAGRFEIWQLDRRVWPAATSPADAAT